MSVLSLNDVIAFVREFQRISDHVPITANTRLDADLGITGLDGEEFLREAATRFAVRLRSPVDGYCTTFSLQPNEYLFGAEGLDLFGIAGIIGYLVRRVRGTPEPVVRDLTVGELYSAIERNWNDGQEAW